jgi:DNA-binding NarL/FixJ family response regulator
VAVLIVSVCAEELFRQRTAAAGARGYLRKNAEIDELFSAVKRVANGEAGFPPAAAPSAKKNGRTPRLSTRQRQVLQGIVDGTWQIAAQLGPSVNTASACRTRLMNNLRIRKAAELVAYAIREGPAMAR